MTYALVSYATASTNSGRTAEAIRIGVQTTDGSVRSPSELAQWPDMLSLLDDWRRARPVLEHLDPAGSPAIADALLVAPIRWPRKVICAGVNYRQHIKEMGGEVPATGWYPFFFLKPPTTTVIGPTDSIVLHDAEHARYDWEAELAVVIGTGGRDIAVSDALAHVAGYSVANDVSARGNHKRTSVPAPPFVYDWFGSKAMDSSLPLGPGITPSFFVADPQDLHLRLWVNDELQQDESTADMICTVAELISAASAIVTLEPGDVIATGTPAGVGSGQGRCLAAGDVVRVAVEGLGSISNSVIAGEGPR